MKSKSIPKKSKIIIVAVFLVLVAVVLDTLFIGNIAYIAKWQECGSRPVTVVEPFSVGFGAQPAKFTVFTEPSIIDGKQPVLFDLTNTTIYCSLDEVKQRYGDKLEVR